VTTTPATDKYAALHAGDPIYEEISRLDALELAARYGRGVENFDRRIFELSDDQLDLAFLPEAGVGRWPVRVLLGHLADAELLYVHRMRRTVGEDGPVLALWDENAAIDAGLYTGGRYPIGAFVAVIHTLRRWTAEWLATLTQEQWARRALHPERGEMTVRLMAVYATWHLEHHARYLDLKVTRFLGPGACAEDRPKSGGCGPGCGCRSG
jgi:hypothetical protein